MSSTFRYDSGEIRVAVVVSLVVLAIAGIALFAALVSRLECSSASEHDHHAHYASSGCEVEEMENWGVPHSYVRMEVQKGGILDV